MSICWRISNHLDLSGKGGVIASGRWHSAGSPIVYLAESPAGALLEHLVHLTASNGKLPNSYNLLEVEIPETCTVTAIEPSAPPDWQSVTLDWKDKSEVTQQLGDAWLAAHETPLARVPSVILPLTWNLLLNPRHPDAAAVRVVSATQSRFDMRLFRFGNR
jgi:RES domain-containing protein